MIPARRGKGERQLGAPPLCEGHSEGPEPVSHGSFDPMREAGAPSTGRFVTVNCKVCMPHRG